MYNYFQKPFFFERLLLYLTMKGLTTQKAFELLISRRGWWRNVNISEIKATNYKTRFKSGQLSIAKIEEILEKAGGTVVQEKLWDRDFIKHNYMTDRYEEEDFADFINQLIDMKCLESKEQGIAKLLLDSSYSELSAKQRYVFDSKVVDPFFSHSCEMCVSPIPWSEMYEAYDNGGYCSWCARDRN